MAGKVFVSYRRGESSQAAGRLKDRLVEAFGEDDVFFDVDSIAFGEDFRKVISGRLSQVDVTLVVIGDDWDFERLASPHDFVRLEVSEALRQEKHVIPILVDDVEMPTESQLPEDMRELAYRTAAPLRPDPDFHTDASRLIESLKETLHGRGTAAAAGHSSHNEPGVDSSVKNENLLTRLAAQNGMTVAALAGGAALFVIVVAFLVSALTSDSSGNSQESAEPSTTGVAEHAGTNDEAPELIEPTSVDPQIARSRFSAWVDAHEPDQCPEAVTALEPGESYPLFDDEFLSSVFFEPGGTVLEPTGEENIGWIGDTMTEDGVRAFIFVPVPDTGDRAMDVVNFELRSIAILDQLLLQDVPLDWACPVASSGAETYGDQVTFHFVDDPALEGSL